MSFLTNHVKDTENPQTYWEHGKFAFWNCCVLQVAVLAGFIHAVFPWWFKFTTSTTVIRAFKKLVNSRRHKDELKEEQMEYYLQPQHLIKRD